MSTQKFRPGEKVDDWVTFFLNCLLNIKCLLMDRLNSPAHSINQLAPREKNILSFVENHPGSKSGKISEKLNIPLPTVKKMLTNMVANKLIIKYGMGADTNYLAEKKNPLKADLMFQLTNANRKKEFLLMNSTSFVEIKKIIVTPQFSWIKPDEWLLKIGQPYLNITGKNNKAISFTRVYPIVFSSAAFKPEIIRYKLIHIPADLKEKTFNLNEYPITIQVELFGSASTFEFDLKFVYDEV